ncbi:hypothetical protein [Gracilibacillus dipsosauri]|uniref:Uncharacterized protein n=1 Tax=Gracilibacillus dipsosauri TaxID=178340 RepID=A0A317KZ14_9BACI|nr:hypothetical protein [Gracilibacillus dipsosauri]PWU68324.1 hypothetical protein DLJ74_07690 [Gracilibacillus dipsosauri]
MTILTSVAVKDGIVLAADSRVTFTEKNQYGDIISRYVEKDNEYKLFFSKERNIGIGYHGNTHINLKPVSGILMEYVHNSISINQTVEEVSKELHELLKTYNKADICFMICGYDDTNTPKMFVSCKDNYVRKNSEQYPYIAIWEGDHTAVSTKFSRYFPFEKYSLVEGIDFAEKIIEHAIKYENQNGYNPCGGPVDVLVITNRKSYFHQIK